MTGQGMHTILVTASGAGALLIWCTAGYIGFRRWKLTVAEAAAYALLSALMVLSFVYQAVFLLGAPVLAMAAETLVTAACLWVTALSGRRLMQEAGLLAAFARAHTIAAASVAAILVVLSARALFPATETIPWETLWPVIDLQRQGSFFPAAATGSPQAMIPVNASILSHMFLRFNTGCGTGIFGLLAYLAIGFSTYALSRRYAWPPTAITITMVVMGLPRLVYQAATPGHEIVPAAAGLLSILALYRVVEQPNAGDLLMLAVSILFGVSGDRLCLVFPSIAVLLSVVVLFRRHGAKVWWLMARTHWRAVLLAALPAVLFSQVWLFAFNLSKGLPWVGSGAAGLSMNMDGIQGSAANLFRYLLESAHFTQPVDLLVQKTIGFRLTALINHIYDVTCGAWFGSRGSAAPFAVAWQADGTTSWFGPLGFLLILPALFYALVRGPRRLKSVALALAGYLYIVTLIPAWVPGNARYFSTLYVCSGFMAAFFLPPWRFSRQGKRALQLFSALLMLYACAGSWMAGLFP